MIFAHKGGMFTAGPALITLLSNLDIDNPIIVDLYDTPISVNRLELKEQVISLWQEQLNAWQVELAELSAQR
jgi:hypothetical protein